MMMEEKNYKYLVAIPLLGEGASLSCGRHNSTALYTDGIRSLAKKRGFSSCKISGIRLYQGGPTKNSSS